MGMIKYIFTVWHWYFPCSRIIGWSIEHYHTMTLKSIIFFYFSPFCWEELWIQREEKVLMFTFWDLHSDLENSPLSYKTSSCHYFQRYILASCPLVGQTLGPRGRKKYRSLPFLRQLHSYFIFYREIDWDVEQYYTM